MKSIIRPIKSDKAKTLKLVKHKDKTHKLDKTGYFLIRTNKKTGKIEVGFCNYQNEMIYKVSGKNPKDLINTILQKKSISMFYHAAYLGRELQKAKMALDFNKTYVQDEELR